MPKYISENAELMKEWDWEANAKEGLDPTQLAWGSNKKANWICSKGHKWKTAIYNRAGRDHTGCPYCARQKLMSGYNDLETEYPKIAKEWHPTKNGNLIPSMVMSGSTKKVWWLCPKGHDYQQSVVRRTSCNTSCPYCSGKRVLEGFKDLASNFPDIAQEWHPTKNGNFKPTQISKGSHKKFWWQCKKCHKDWQATVINRTHNKSGCPFCYGAIPIKGVNDLATTHPDIAKDWDFEKNVGLSPEQVKAGSDKLIWWKCHICGQSWHCSIIRRVKSAKCPRCSDSKLIVGFNDLQTKFPEIAKDWDYKNNNGRTPDQFQQNSHYNASWKCHICGYKWKTRIQIRTSGHSNCHKCNNTALIPGVNDLETLYPEIAQDWDYERNGGLTPRDIRPGRKYKAAWKCHICGHRWQIAPNNRTSNKSGCPKCAMAARTSYPEQALYYYVKKLYPDAINGYKAPFLEKMEVDIYIPSIHYAIEYDGKHWHSERKMPLERKKYKLCQKNGIHLIRVREKMSPLGADTADRIISVGKVDGKDNLEYTINEVIKLINFARKKIDINLLRDEKFIRSAFQGKARNPISILCPELLKEWDYEANGDITPDKVNVGSKYKAHWICPDCGYKYQAAVNNRTSNKSGCIKCAYKKLATLKSKAVSKINLKTNKVIKTYPSVAEAARQNNIVAACITRVCNGERKQTGGYKWCYGTKVEVNRKLKLGKQLEFDFMQKIDSKE